MSFTFGLIIGLIIGANFSLLIGALIVSAKNNDKDDKE